MAKEDGKIFNSNDDLVYLTLKEILLYRNEHYKVNYWYVNRFYLSNTDTLNVQNKYFYYQMYGQSWTFRGGPLRIIIPAST